MNFLENISGLQPSGHVPLQFRRGTLLYRTDGKGVEPESAEHRGPRDYGRKIIWTGKE